MYEERVLLQVDDNNDDLKKTFIDNYLPELQVSNLEKDIIKTNIKQIKSEDLCQRILVQNDNLVTLITENYISMTDLVF
jgi:hypothetical protein